MGIMVPCIVCKDQVIEHNYKKRHPNTVEGLVLICGITVSNIGNCIPKRSGNRTCMYL